MTSKSITDVLATARDAQQPNHQSELGSTSGQSPGVALQTFASTEDNVGRVQHFASERDVLALLTEASRPHVSKKASPLFSPGVFPAGPIKGHIPETFHRVVVEHDAGTVSVDEAMARLRAAGIAGYLYTSASHTPEAARWRIVAPLKTPCSAEHYPHLVALLNGALGGCLAPEAGDLARRWYFGRVRTAVEYRVEVNRAGVPLDVLAAGEHGIEPVPVKAAKPVKQKQDYPSAYAPRSEVDINRAIGALQAIPNSGEKRLDRGTWRSVGLGFAEATGAAPRALEAFVEWTADPGKEVVTRREWAGFKPGAITENTLFGLALRAGWVDPAHAPDASGFEDLTTAALGSCIAGTLLCDGEDGLTDDDRVTVATRPDVVEWLVAANGEWAALLERLGAKPATPLPSAAELIAALRTEPREAVISTWAARAAHLFRTEGEEVITEVERLTGIGARKLAGALKEARQTAAKERSRAAFERKRAGRVVIEVEKGEVGSMSRAADRAIVGRGAPGAYMNFGGTPVCVRVEQLPSTHLIDDAEAAPPPVPQFKPFNEPLMQVTVEEAAIFVAHDAKGQPYREDVPPKVISQMLKNPSDLVPKVSGLLAHPVVLPDGSLVAEDGLHERTGLYLHGAAIDGLRPYTREEASAAIERIRNGLFDEFDFASPLDALVAVGALLTAMNRRVMPSAPGVAVLASRQSSGKTTLARIVHLAITGHDMPVTTLSESTEENKKHLFSMLRRSPEMVCFDNIADGFTFRSPALAAMMTSDTFSDRLLGVSEDLRVQTNTFWAITGNNLSLGADEVSRWMVCRLEPKSARPEERRFKNADVVQMVRRQRQRILRDIVGIVSGFLESGERMEPSSGSRYPVWEKLVRLPLIWAGAGDVAEVFAQNRELSPDEIAKAGLLSALYDLSGGDPFKAIDVGDWLRGMPVDGGLATLPEAKREAVRRLRAALAETRMKNADAPSASSIGRVLGGSANAVVETSHGPLRLRQRRTRDETVWVVQPEE